MGIRCLNLVELLPIILQPPTPPLLLKSSCKYRRGGMLKIGRPVPLLRPFKGSRARIDSTWLNA